MNSRDEAMRTLARADLAARVSADENATFARLQDLRSEVSDYQPDDAPTRGGGRRLSAPRRRLALVLGGCVAAVAVAVALSVVGGGGAGVSSASAAGLLRAAAAATQRQADELPTAGEYFYVRSLATTLIPIRRDYQTPLPRGPHQDVRIELETRQAWSPSRQGWIQTRIIGYSFPTAAARERWIALGRPHLPPAGLLTTTRPVRQPVFTNRTPLGNGGITLRQLQHATTNPHLLYQQLFARRSAAAALDLVSLVLRDFPIPARVQAAIYRSLALVPGLHFARNVHTLTGQTGDAVWAPTGPAPDANRDELILNPTSGSLLGSQTIITNPRSEGLPYGTVLTQSAIVERTITTQPKFIR